MLVPAVLVPAVLVPPQPVACLPVEHPALTAGCPLLPAAHLLVCSAHGDLTPQEQALLKALFCLRNKGQVCISAESALLIQ